MADEERLRGRVALITGGGGEIGTAIAKRFAMAGAAVAVGDIDPAKAAATAKAIAGAGHIAIDIVLDVGDPASAASAVERTVAEFGRLTTLVNVAAALTPDGTAVTLALDEWEKAL